MVAELGRDHGDRSEKQFRRKDYKPGWVTDQVAPGGVRFLSRSLAAGGQGCPFQKGEPGEEGSWGQVARGSTGLGGESPPGKARGQPLPQVPARGFWSHTDPWFATWLLPQGEGKQRLQRVREGARVRKRLQTGLSTPLSPLPPSYSQRGRGAE